LGTRKFFKKSEKLFSPEEIKQELGKFLTSKKITSAKEFSEEQISKILQKATLA
jgi:hypothetical protein